jgi:uncharacterized membrane protein YbaN (DUF454 family)
VYVGLGSLFFALGVAGAVLPVLPTTPFMLLALWAFSKSSARLEAWLLAHKRFGPPLVRWREHRVVPLRVKLVAWASMAASLAWMTFWSPAPRWTVVVTAALMAYGVWFVARLPSKPPAAPAPPE